MPTNRLLPYALLAGTTCAVFAFAGFAPRCIAQSDDELSAFAAPPRPSQKDDDALREVLRLILIGEKFDRLELRRRLVHWGRPPSTFLHAELTGPNAEAARHATLVVARSGDREALPDLRQVLEGQAKGAPRHAAMALGQLGGAEDTDLLIRLARTAKRPEIRRAAVYALGISATPDDLPRFSDLYEADNAQEWRSACLLALGRIGGPGALRILAKGVTQTKESVRRAATLGLADLGSREGLPLLRARLTDADDQTAKYAALGLALVRDDSIPAMIEELDLLRHKRDEVRAAAVTALGVQDSDPARRVLTAWLENSRERERVVKQATAFSLCRLGLGGTRAFMALVADPDPDVVRAAALASRAAANGGPIGGFDALLDKRQKESVRKLGLLLLARIAPEKFQSYSAKAIDAYDDKKDFLEAAAELAEVIAKKGTGEALLDARIQVLVDDLGGSPEWSLLQAIHKEFLAIEHIDGPITPRGSGQAPGASGGSADPSRPKQDRWTHEEEDMRLWYDLFPYFDVRKPRAGGR